MANVLGVSLMSFVFTYPSFAPIRAVRSVGLYPTANPGSGLFAEPTANANALTSMVGWLPVRDAMEKTAESGEDQNPTAERKQHAGRIAVVFQSPTPPTLTGPTEAFGPMEVRINPSVVGSASPTCWNRTVPWPWLERGVNKTTTRVRTGNHDFILRSSFIHNCMPQAQQRIGFSFLNETPCLIWSYRGDPNEVHMEASLPFLLNAPRYLAFSVCIACT